LQQLVQWFVNFLTLGSTKPAQTHKVTPLSIPFADALIAKLACV
jgi:hypothetical protein